MKTYSTGEISLPEEKSFLIDDFIFSKQEGNYCTITTKSGIIRTIRITKKNLMNMINFECHQRVHHIVEAGKSYLVKLDCIEDIINKDNSFKIKVRGTTIERGIVIGVNECIKISRDAARELKNLMDEYLSPIYRTNSVGIELAIPVSDLYKCGIGISNDHEYVDLGLPSGNLWATYNVEAVYIFKDLYEQPDIRECKHTVFRREDRCTKESYTTVEYTGLNNIDAADYVVTDDIAQNHWRGDWQMPSYSDFRELFDECDEVVWCHTADYEYGFLFKKRQKDGDRFLFLPCDLKQNNNASYLLYEYNEKTAMSMVAEITKPDNIDKPDLSYIEYGSLKEEAFVRPIIKKNSNEN